MNARRAVLVSIALAAAAAAAPARLFGAVERALYVTVVDKDGAPVKGLGPADFVVREDNVQREVLRVQPATEPMQVALLVDNSQAARDTISHMRTALPPFLTALTNPNEADRRNEVAMLTFGERPTIVTEYTSSLGELQKGVNRIWSLPGAGAYLQDAVYEICTGFRKREARRPVIVAISIEGPEFSYRRYDQVLPQIDQAGAAFYVVAVGRPSGSLSDEMRSRGIVLDEGTRRSGGTEEQLLTPMGLGPRLKHLADQLTHQYLVTYAHPESLIPPERVTVEAAKAGLTARGTLVKEEKK